MAKENLLRIRIEEPFKKELERKAKELNISLSAYVRMVLSKNLNL
jgi:antitoxin component of RelBE/YafQ-DinJ toxin-antitoxin module